MLKETGKDYMQNQNFLGMDIWPGERSIEKSRTLLRKRLKSLYQHKYDYLKAKNSKYVKDLDFKGYTKKYAPALYQKLVFMSDYRQFYAAYTDYLQNPGNYKYDDNDGTQEQRR